MVTEAFRDGKTYLLSRQVAILQEVSSLTSNEAEAKEAMTELQLLEDPQPPVRI